LVQKVPSRSSSTTHACYCCQVPWLFYCDFASTSYEPHKQRVQWINPWIAKSRTYQVFYLVQILTTSYTPAHILTINIYLSIIIVPNNLYISYLHIRNQRVLTLDKPKTLTINFPIIIIILRLSFLLNLTLPLSKY